MARRIHGDGVIPIPKKNSGKKCKEFRTISLISYNAKILLRILNRRLRSKMEEKLEDEQFGFRKGRGTRDAIRLNRTIGERYIEKNKDVYEVSVHLEKAFDIVDWKEFMGILKKIFVYWKERRLLRNFYMKQRRHVRIGEEISEGREIGRRVRQGCPLSPTFFNIFLEYLMKNCF